MNVLALQSLGFMFLRLRLREGSSLAYKSSRHGCAFFISTLSPLSAVAAFSGTSVVCWRGKMACLVLQVPSGFVFHQANSWIDTATNCMVILCVRYENFPDFDLQAAGPGRSYTVSFAAPLESSSSLEMRSPYSRWNMDTCKSCEEHQHHIDHWTTVHMSDTCSQTSG